MDAVLLSHILHFYQQPYTKNKEENSELYYVRYMIGTRRFAAPFPVSTFITYFC